MHTRFLPAAALPPSPPVVAGLPGADSWRGDSTVVVPPWSTQPSLRAVVGAGTSGRAQLPLPPTPLITVQCSGHHCTTDCTIFIFLPRLLAPPAMHRWRTRALARCVDKATRARCGTHRVWSAAHAGGRCRSKKGNGAAAAGGGRHACAGRVSAPVRCWTRARRELARSCVVALGRCTRSRVGTARDSRLRAMEPRSRPRSVSPSRWFTQARRAARELRARAAS